MKKRYVVRLSGVEREQLEGLVKRGREAAYRRRHAQVFSCARWKRYWPCTSAGSDPAYPVVCMDETSVQCVREVRDPIPAKPGQSGRKASDGWCKKIIRRQPVSP